MNRNNNGGDSQTDGSNNKEENLYSALNEGVINDNSSKEATRRKSFPWMKAYGLLVVIPVIVIGVIITGFVVSAKRAAIVKNQLYDVNNKNGNIRQPANNKTSSIDASEDISDATTTVTATTVTATTETATAGDSSHSSSGATIPNVNRRYPFFVTFQDHQLCAGTLVAPDIVLTAAQCADYIKYGTLATINAFLSLPENDTNSPRMTGARKHIKRHVTQTVVHPAYNFPYYDYLLVKLDHPIETVQPVILNVAQDYPNTNEPLTVIGAHEAVGNTHEFMVLREVTVHSVNDTICNQAYEEDIKTDIMVCAGMLGDSQDVCNVDAGGPLLNRYGLQVGIVSSGDGCGRPGKPGVYSRISSAVDWILENICSLSESQSVVSCERFEKRDESDDLEVLDSADPADILDIAFTEPPKDEKQSGAISSSVLSSETEVPTNVGLEPKSFASGKQQQEGFITEAPEYDVITVAPTRSWRSSRRSSNKHQYRHYRQHSRGRLVTEAPTDYYS